MKDWTILDWVQEIRSGNRLALSKAITLVESDMPERQHLANQLMEEIEKIQVKSFRLAITGVPGAGKSTLIDRLGMYWVGRGEKVAVLAVDPTSSLSQGSILGDKTRMTDLSRHENAFIRPSPTRLFLGGIAPATFETTLLCEAAGYSRIVVETVGVGQSETLASKLCDACVLVLVTGTGDDLQGVKKGILEAADIVLVNKADGANMDQALAFSRELQSLRNLWPDRRNGNKAKIITGSALNEDSISKICLEVDKFQTAIVENGSCIRNRKDQLAFWLKQNLYRRMHLILENHPKFRHNLAIAEKDLSEGKYGLTQAVTLLSQALFKDWNF